MARLALIWIFAISLSAFSAPAARSSAVRSTLNDPLTQSAEYYFSRHDYRQALTLWSEILKKNPENFKALLRTAELTALVEGRPASTDLVLEYYGKQRATLDESERRQLADRFLQLQSAFLSDDAQSWYLQAEQRLKRKEWQAALTSLDHILAQDRLNFLVLRARARAERQLKMWEKLYETLQVSYGVYPFSNEGREELMELHSYFKAYDAVVQMKKKYPDFALTPRERQALGLAYIETGLFSDGGAMLNDLVLHEKTSLHPAVFYGLAKVAVGKGASPSQVSGYFGKFAILSEAPRAALIEGLDPYNTPEKIADVNKLRSRD